MLASPAAGPTFEALLDRMRAAPLHDVTAAAAGEAVPAMGFAFGIASGWAGPAGLIWIGADQWTMEAGALSPRGLAAFGVDLEALVAVHARTGVDALWASEQALGTPGAMVVCALADRDVDLTASRRLLLQAERAGSHAILLRGAAHGRPSPASAAYTRWRVAGGASEGADRLLGRPAVRATLMRQRGGAPGACFDLEWNADARAFRTRAPPERDSAVDRDLAAASGDRPAAAFRRRAV